MPPQSKLEERLAKRQAVTIDKRPDAETIRQSIAPKTHKEKIDAGWKRVATVLPPEEHQAFKIAALKADKEMSDIIRNLVTEWLSRQASE